jgi:copper chaperone CopZ
MQGPSLPGIKEFRLSTQTILKVTGMKCSGCSANVERALKAVTGVSSVKIELKSGQAWVEHDPAKANEKDLANAIKKAGYGVG